MKTQFRTILMVIAVTCISLATVQAQGNKRPGSKQGNDKSKKVENLRIGFITDRVDLDEKEAQKFWPVYNKQQERLKQNNDRRKSLNGTDIEALPAGDREKVVDEMLQIEQDEAKIKRESHNALKGVLDPVKLGKLYKAERDFKKMLLEKIGKDKN